MKRVALLTGGGDCPGLNAVIRAVVRKAIDRYDFEVYGILDGWAGLVNGMVEPLAKHNVSGILPKGGTIIGTSRTNPLKSEESFTMLLENIKKFEIDVLIAIGGDDTLGVALKLHEKGIPVVGVPKTIDNDLSGTDYTFGFDTAVNIATEAIDRLHTTAESHHRIMVVEVMGRHTGWIATYAGLAAGADCILIPETPFDIDDVCDLLSKRKERGRNFSIVVVAEGAKPSSMSKLVTVDKSVDEFGHVRLGGIGEAIAKRIEKKTGQETRVVVLGHLQRGGTPTSYDRILATRFGIKAIDMVHDRQFGYMAALRGSEIVPIPLEEATSKLKTVNLEIFDIAKVFFG